MDAWARFAASPPVRARSSRYGHKRSGRDRYRRAPARFRWTLVPLPTSGVNVAQRTKKPRRRQRGEAGEGAIPSRDAPARGPDIGATPAEPHPRNGRSSPRFPLQKPAANRRAFREATMHLRLLTVLTVLLTV